MTSSRFIGIAVPAAVALAALAVVLPASYAKLMHPAALAAASGLALWVAVLYRSAMRLTFVLLAGFLALYAPTASSWLQGYAADRLGGAFLGSLLGYQVLTYSTLLAAAVLIVSMMEVRRVGRTGWLITGVAAGFAGVFLANGVATFGGLWDGTRTAGALYMTVRTFDLLIVVALMPVLWLYFQNASARYQESASFMLTMLGVVLSLVLVYFYELVRQTPLADIASSSYQTGSVLDALYLFGYLLIGIGLFAHRKHQEWTIAEMGKVLA